jgi:hypothetical protein
MVSFGVREGKDSLQTISGINKIKSLFIESGRHVLA